MKAGGRRFLLGVVVCAIGAFAYAHFALLDGVRGLVLPLIFRDTTIYAVGYEQNTFKHLHIGVNTKTVLQTLGRPWRRTNVTGSNAGATLKAAWIPIIAFGKSP
jgi:hypothetical protein